MTKHTNTLSRRKFLKGAAYTSALSVGSLSGLALAKPGPSAASSTGLKQGAVSGGLMSVNLSNQSGKAVALDARQPVSLEKVNGWVVVKINKAKPDANETTTGRHMSLAAGQQCAFTVDAELAPMLTAAGTNIIITDEYSTLDNVVPVTPFNAMAA